MNLLGLKIVSLTGNGIYCTIVTYQKQFQSSEVFHMDKFLIQHCFYFIWVTLITVYAILVLLCWEYSNLCLRKWLRIDPEKLHADILEFHNWLTDNDLSLNLKKGKTETMIFGTSIRVKKAAPPNIQIKGTSINQTSSYKYLETYLDSTLALNGYFNSNTKSSVLDYDCCRNYAQIWM